MIAILLTFLFPGIAFAAKPENLTDRCRRNNCDGSPRSSNFMRMENDKVHAG